MGNLLPQWDRQEGEAMTSKDFEGRDFVSIDLANQTLQERDERIRELEDENDLYEDALDRIISELGVPTIDYPAPVANAWAIAWNARHEEQKP